MKTKIMKKIALLGVSLLAIGTIGAIITYPKAHQKVELNINKTIDAKSIETVKINGKAMDVTLEESTDNKIHVNVNGETLAADKFEVKTKQTGKDLEITLKEPKQSNVSITLFFDMNYQYATISLPKSITKADVRTNFGNINLHDFVGKNLALKTNAGTVSASNLKLNSFTANVDAGDINLTSSVIKETKITASAGQISLGRLVGENTEAKSSAGEISFDKVTGNIIGSTNAGTIKMRGKSIDQNTDLQTNFGEILILTESKPEDLDIAIQTDLGDISLFGQTNRTQTFGNGKNKLVAKTNAGSVKIAKASASDYDYDFDDDDDSSYDETEAYEEYDD